MDVKTAMLLLQILSVLLVRCNAIEDEGEVGFGGFKSGTGEYLSDPGVELPASMYFPGLMPVYKRAGDFGYTDFSESEAGAIVDRHNTDRAKANPPASNMRVMVCKLGVFSLLLLLIISIMLIQARISVNFVCFLNLVIDRTWFIVLSITFCDVA